ncbi:protein-glutamate O-methyltransferase CheR [Pseudomonas chlororaphis]|uniref:Protein-glutamate O-methyltransferase CheR n=4 Tax=Pseudomonas chlororaphis TaxID=587753 RepID=A0AAP9VY82_9PSED|nr:MULTISPECIES: protein-glutamate O-methyltransferase CheR [Pseudomonas]AIC18262.1 chemotaxis protein CheR [Pseudomonas chlororaphis]AUG39365.1 protein-glutamate O-methyltransferase CheR [Pseudomonas chlororaphis]AZE21595.1 Chemotaxis protein methyltransferase [Pseudomonas chlororaphis subsp. aureofaciens]AZE27952.1 Chemotaxis protein methyltransferase [Pseudomonas chlororaphis subsp. aureofaciens]AZE40530.1 Chemotaxis protein methyltransferase [Pseudomonas chlororaphis subsp. aureofaciens]
MSSDQRFFDFLKERIGLDVASVGPAIIERAVRQRSIAQQAPSTDHYWQTLQGSRDEQQALIEAVIVPETWFFRYPESFATLAKLALSRLSQLKGMRALRILSLPCSTGEEPYSIAMALFDAGLAPHQFKVDGFDVSPLSVERARQAVYGKNSFRGQHSDFRERHFTAEDERYSLSERVREQVRLQVGNLLDPTLLAHEPPYDFVFCRNLLIYFDQPTQRQVFEVLKRLTHVEGVLFIGPAEGSLLGRLGMRSIGIAQSFAFSRHNEPEPEPAPAFVPSALPARQPVRSIAPPVRSRPFSSAAVASQRPAPTRPVSDATTLLASIAALANEGKSAEARAACEHYLDTHEPVAQVFYWLGLLSDVAGSALEAQGFYRKALYLDPQHAEALAHLAALLASQGDVAGARRLQERAARSGRAADSERKS